MSTVGQAAGYVIGGVVGAAFPAVGWVIGAQIGGMIGGYIDPPKGQNTVGPRLEDLTVQTSTYGAVIPRLKGTIAVTGNVFWLEGDKLKEITNTKKVGGKGGPTAKQTTYSYTATFAVGLSHQISAPIGGIRRLWLANTLVYDAGSGDINSVIASNQQAGVLFKFYDGRDDQAPDPRMQADKGINNVSGYPGRCYIVFYDLDLTEKYNNTLMATQVKVELVNGPAGVSVSPVIKLFSDSSSTTYKINNAIFSDGEIKYSVYSRDVWNGNITSVDFYRGIYGNYHNKYQSIETGIGPTVICRPIPVCQSDTPVMLLQTTPASPFDTYSILTVYDDIGGILSSDQIAVADFNIYKDKTAAVDGSEWFIASREGLNVFKFDNAGLIGQTAASYDILSIGLSESFIFGLKYESINTSTITIYKFDRTSLALLETWVDSGNGNMACLQVVNDTTVYVAVEGGSILKWESGAITENMGVLVSPTFNDGAATLPGWFSVFSDAPPYVLSTSNYGALDDYVFVGHPSVSAAPAKLHDIVTDECALAGIQASDLDLSELVNSDVRGYRVSQAGSVRAVLEQLQAAFPFDVIQSGYKLKFKSRGAAAVLTVPELDLGAHTGTDQPSRFMLTTEMPSQVPAKVTFNFLNADREYDPDEQSAAFTAQDVKNSYTVSLPLVMTPTEALQAADVLLKKEQRERTSAGTFWLPPSDDYRKLEAADVIDVIAQGRTHTIRLTKVTQLPDGRVECDGKMTSSAAYASTAQAQPSLALGQTTVPLAGLSELLLLDMPRIVVDQDGPGISAGMYGYTSGWPGGVAYRSDDSGDSFSAITAFNIKTEVFSVSGTLANVPYYAVDYSSIITVTPDWPGADLFSITEAQFLALGNLAAYGAPGRWEIIAFKDVTDNTGSYTLQNFMRGRFGTEWAMSLHASGDKLVMLDLDALDFIGLPLSAINSPRLWRGVTSGASVDTASDITSSYAGVNLKPLAPVDFAGSRDVSSFDWSIQWTRRSRSGTEAFSGLVTPIGESTEAYEVEIWNVGYTVLKRTISGLSAPSATYTASQQIADFGSNQATLYVRVYQLSSIIGRGLALEATVYHSIKIDGSGYSPAILALSPLLYYKMDGNTTTLTDSGSAANNATAAGSLSYLQTSLLTGGTPGYSIKFSTGYASVPHIAGMNGGYTLVFLMQPSSLPGAESGFLHKGDVSGGGVQGHYYSLMPDGTLKCTWHNGSWSSVNTTGAMFSAGVKAWVGIKYDGSTTLTIYRNGVVFQTITLASAFVDNGQAFIINGSKSGGIYGLSVDNKMDEFAWFNSQLSDAQMLALYEES